MAATAVVTVSAEEFPLTFHTIAAKDVQAFPGGYGVFGQLRLIKPGKLEKEPKAVSRHPLYAECRDTATGAGFVVRLDESKGDGQGYDQLLVDMNQNGDLGDDVPPPVVVLPRERTASPMAERQKLFGPISAPAGKTVLGNRPVYYAEVYVNDIGPLLRSVQNAESIYAGYVRLKAGWYADATVELSGVKRKVGVFDADSNFQLGDGPKSKTYRRAGDEESWYFAGGDSFLTDADSSGAFERDPFDTENCSFGPVLYLGATPCKVALPPDGKSLRVEPWTEPLAEVTLQPHGDQVCCVTLAWEQPNKEWQLVRASAADGKLKVPPGNYRLFRCDLLSEGAPADQVRAAAYQYATREPVALRADKANTLRCGAPLEIKVTAQKRIPESWETNNGDLRRARLASDSEFVLTINANVRGAGGEMYQQYAKGDRLAKEPPQPTFTVMDGNGKKVGSGKLEYG